MLRRWRPTLRARLIMSFTLLVALFLVVAIINYLQVEHARSKIEVQTSKTALEFNALQLEVAVQNLKDISSGLMISRDPAYIKKFDDEKKVYSSLIDAVGNTAVTPEELGWRSKLILTSTDFLDTFNRAVSLIQNKTLKEDALRLNMSDLYDLAQQQRDKLFQLADNFDQDYAKAAASAQDASFQTMKQITGLMMALAVGLLLISAVIALLLIRSFLKPIRRLQLAAHTLSEGDLRVAIGSDATDELGMLSRDFDRMTAAVRDMIGGSQQVASQLSDEADAFRAFAGQTAEANEQIVRAISEVAGGTDQQATLAEASVLILDELAAAMDDIALLVEEARGKSEAAGRVTGQGQQAMSELRTAALASDERIEEVGESMQQLLDGSKQIGKIVTSMTDLASQTNVLALNASIEAARAGEHGRGFAVVADQIRQLSAESGGASRQIGGLIASLQKQIAELGERMGKAREVLALQSGKVGETIGAFTHIRTATEEMSATIDQVGTQIVGVHTRNKQLLESVHQVAAVAQESAAAVEQVGASTQEQDGSIRQIAERAEQMRLLSHELFRQVSQFRIGDEV